MAILKSSFFKNADHEDPFHVQCYGARLKPSVETNESDDKCAKCQGNYIEGEEWLRCLVCQQWYHEDCFLRGMYLILFYH